MYAGMNRNELRALLALIVAIALGIGAQTYAHRQRQGAMWVEHDFSIERVDSERGNDGKAPRALGGPTGGGTRQGGATEGAARSRKRASSAWTDGRLDINRARAGDLETLPQIGKTRAEAIVAYRERVGGFPQARDLLNVSGIGEGIFQGIESLVFVAPPAPESDKAAATGEALTSPGGPGRASVARAHEAGQPAVKVDEPGPPAGPPAAGVAPTPLPPELRPVNINAATLEELQTLYDIGPKTAAKIIEYRRRHGPFRRPSDLTKVPGIGPKTFEANRHRITVR
ncbi:MAG TPA: helix-hairpin-helix domain-containing protein [Sumerlaeia bacterium]|nr:helix-hairpin-helix domain-containing protein [Sumerlaeia bacterium]